MTHQRDLSQQRFGDLAKNYVASSLHNAGYTLNKLVEQVAIQPGQRALDVATGGGHVALALAALGAVVTASDLTPRMLAAARAQFAAQALPAHYVQNEAGVLPFPAQCFDVVTVRHAPHHFPDVWAFVREAFRVLKPGGVFGVVDQIAPEDKAGAEYVNALEYLRDPSHGRQLSVSEWEGLFLDAGFHIAHSEVATQRYDLAYWASLQACDEDTILRLRVMLTQAPPNVARYFAAEFLAGGAVTFSHHDIILIGRKP